MFVRPAVRVAFIVLSGTLKANVAVKHLPRMKLKSRNVRIAGKGCSVPVRWSRLPPSGRAGGSGLGDDERRSEVVVGRYFQSAERPDRRFHQFNMQRLD